MHACKGSWHGIFILLFITIFTSCVPKATETKASCGANQAFNSVTRTCYSTSEIRYKPVATKSSHSLSEEVPAIDIELTYTDGNKNSAASCRVSSVSSNIEVISPVVYNNKLFNAATNLYDSAYLLAGNIPAPSNVAAATARTNMLAALNSAKLSKYAINQATHLGSFISNVNTLISLAALYPSYPALVTLISQTETFILTYNVQKAFFDNKCECVSGVCRTTIVPKQEETGSASFTYTISDQDGESSPKTVSLSIAAMSKSTSHYRPVPTSGSFTGVESGTVTPLSYTVTIPYPADIDGTPNANFTYTLSTAPTLGTISSCMAGTNDRICVYTPNSGDGNDSAILSPATLTLGDLIYTAVADGTSGQNISVQYFDLSSDNPSLFAFDSTVSKVLPFGLVSATTNESFVRVEGNAIKVFINETVTSSLDILNLINAHPKASKLVTVSGGSVSTFPDASSLTPAAQSLTGGADAYDKFTYTVSNGSASSSVVGTMVIKLSANNDAPRVPVEASALFSQTLTYLEESTNTAVLAFTEVDSSTSPVVMKAKIDAVSPTCQANMTNAAFDLMPDSPNFTLTIPAPAVATCTGASCSRNLSIQALLNFSGTACLYYSYVDASGAESRVQPVNIVVTNINDEPVITALANQTINEDLDGSISWTDLTVNPGGGVYEANQLLTIKLTSNLDTLVPDNDLNNALKMCRGYTPGAGTPVGAIVPTATGILYFDTTNFVCYESIGTLNATQWKLRPSLTAFPLCPGFESYGVGTPVGIRTPTAINRHYLDTQNNVCYISTGTTSANWKKDPAITSYKIVHIPEKDKSGLTTITAVVDDDGGTSNGGDNSSTDDFVLTVAAINDLPYLATSFNSVSTNEGGDVQTDALVIDEDEADTDDEDSQEIYLIEMLSDNQSVLPNNAITLFHDLNDNGVEDSGEAIPALPTFITQPVCVTAKCTSSNRYKIYLKLDPVNGVSGNANITFKFSDQVIAPAAANSTNSVSKSFSFIVHPVAALHGGWRNISSQGLRHDKVDEPIGIKLIGSGTNVGDTDPDSDIKCNYNKSTDTNKCSGAQCRGTSSPHSTITPDAANVIFWDATNKRCYRSTGTTAFSWVELKTSCPITRTSTYCSSNNCIQSTNPSGVLTPAVVGQYVYNTSNKACYVSTGLVNTDWDVYVPSKVTLEWKSFTMLGASIGGYNVYRREPGTDYNFKGGHLKNTSSTVDYSLVGSNTTKFIDTTAIAGKIYFYTVRPADATRRIPTYTSAVYSEVRVLAAPTNYSFVHRWMINQEVCNSMNITTQTSPNFVDQDKNYRCQYSGMGQTQDPVDLQFYFDYGKDLLVDSQELGCPYSSAPKCGANGCIGLDAGVPTATTGVVDGDIYYSRRTGICYAREAGAWLPVVSATLNASIVSKFTSALNAPLTNLTQTRANAVCTTRTPPTTDALLPVAKLPSKLDFNAYAASRSDITDSEITTLEQGLSLNVTSGCNSSAASGIELAYDDSAIPLASFNYSLPGSFSSGIRSVVTGSIPVGSFKSTESCTSRYGIQDLYGNVAEWTTDKMNCVAGPIPVCTSDAASTMNGFDFDPGAPVVRYAFDLQTGPFNDTDLTHTGPFAGDNDEYLTSWTISDELFNAGKFSFPLAMPINVDIDDVVAIATSPAIPYLLDIGPSSGITSARLHQDVMTINGESILNGSDVGAFVMGGSYLSGTGAGRFSAELADETIGRKDIGQRCIIEVESTDYGAVDPKHPYNSNY